MKRAKGSIVYDPPGRLEAALSRPMPSMPELGSVVRKHKQDCKVIAVKLGVRKNFYMVQYPAGYRECFFAGE